MMNIKKISVFQVDLPLVEGRYTWANGKFVETFDSTIVEIETYDGLCGLARYALSDPFIFLLLALVREQVSVSLPNI